jgi:hypothetical protein
MSSKPDGLTWSIFSQATPRFGSTGRFDNKPYNIIQTTNTDVSGAGSPIFTTSASPSFYGANITLANQMPQYANFTAAFDQYRIMEVEAWITPRPNSATPDTSGANLYSVIDYDNSTTPTSISSFGQYTNAIVTPLTNGHYRKFKPHIAMAAYQGTFVGFVNQTDQWIDSTNTTVQYYGIKVGAEVTTATTYSVYMTYRVWVQFRNVY